MAKRDLEIFRKIAEETERLTRSNNCVVYEETNLSDSGVDYETFAYHVVLMLDNGLLVGNADFCVNQSPAIVEIHRLTNLGHDFLDLSRNSSTWSKFKNWLLQNPEIALSVALEALPKILGV